MGETNAARDAVERVFGLFERHGDTDYLGEPVSKLQHSLQCAQLAQSDGQPTAVVLGALLHDIGHLVGQDQGTEPMVTDGVKLGARDHDALGERFLQRLGFPDSVTQFVGKHVQAKRYLVYKYDDYYQDLSSASKMTLEHQGGPMSRDEAMSFELLPMFEALLKMRRWDELAKDPGCKTLTIDKYKDLCYEYILAQTR